MTHDVARIACLLALVAASCRSAPQAAPPLPDAPLSLPELEQALQQDPDDPELSIRIGRIELERGNSADAYVAFRRASELAPEDIRAVSGLALAADALGFESEAARAYERWSELEDRGANGAAGDPDTDPW